MTSKSRSHFGQLDRYTICTFCLLLLLCAQVPSVHGFVLPELGSGMDPCLKNCSSNNSTQVICGSDGQTYANECELENARCDDEGLSVASDGPCAEPEDCIKDCSKETLSEVCGSNAVTYANECEFNNAQCEVEDNDVFIIYHDPCVTLPPPPENLCRKHQDRHLDLPWEEYYDTCLSNLHELHEKAENGNLELMDIHKDCYEPYCVGEKYNIIQCSDLLQGWCWCSDSDGIRIEGTLKKGLTLNDCLERESCTYDGQEYYDGDLFLPESGCGLCECLDGKTTCFHDYIPTTNGHLNETQIESLREELVQLFFFQYNHDEHVLIDIRHTHQHPSIISASKKLAVLQWKFGYYDRNGNNGLTPGEQYLFQLDIHSFIQCSSFFDHVNDLMDSNNDSVVLKKEWEQFFHVDMADPTPSSIAASNADGNSNLGKRSAPQEDVITPANRFQNRKKFYYTLA